MAVTAETKTQSAAPAKSEVKTSTRVRLYTPGPVEIPARVLRALSAVPPHHRTEVFRATFRRVTDALRELHRTQGEVFMLAASGLSMSEVVVLTRILRPRVVGLFVAATVVLYVGLGFGFLWV